MKIVRNYIFLLCLSISLLGQDAKVAFEFLNKTKFPIEFSLGTSEKPPTTANLKTLEAGKKFAQQVPDSSAKPIQVLFREKGKPDIAYVYELKAKKGKKLYVRLIDDAKGISFEPQTFVLNNLDKANIALIKTTSTQQTTGGQKPTSAEFELPKIPEMSAEEKDLMQKSQALDLTILLDNGSDVIQAEENKTLGAIARDIPDLIRQEIPFIITENLVPQLKEYAKDSYDKLLSNDWIVLSNKDPFYIIGLPKNRWPRLDISNLSNLKYIGFNKEELKILDKEGLDKIAVKRETRTSINNLTGLQVIKFQHLFAKNPYAKKYIYLAGHGSEGLVAGMKLDSYKEILEFFNNQGVDLLYISSCYAGGVNLLNAYETKVLDYTKPIKLNYFLFIGSVTDSVSLATEINFNNFYDAIHQFFSPQGPSTKKPLEAIAQSIWGKKQSNIPSVRFPGEINYFKALNIDNTIEIITYAKARAAELEGKLVSSAKKDITITKDKKAVLVYPPVIKVPIEVYYKTIFWENPFISMIPGNAIHYFEKLTIPVEMENVHDYFIGTLEMQMFFKARKLFFIRNILTQKENQAPKNYLNYMIFVNGPNKTVSELYLLEGQYYFTKYTAKNLMYTKAEGEREISQQEAFDIIRQSIKDVGSWKQPIGDERPEDLIETALQNT